jgi:hypothetical protein
VPAGNAKGFERITHRYRRVCSGCYFYESWRVGLLTRGARPAEPQA